MHRRAWRIFRHLEALRVLRRTRVLLTVVSVALTFGLLPPALAAASLDVGQPEPSLQGDRSTAGRSGGAEGSGAWLPSARGATRAASTGSGAVPTPASGVTAPGPGPSAVGIGGRSGGSATEAPTGQWPIELPESARADLAGGIPTRLSQPPAVAGATPAPAQAPPAGANAGPDCAVLACVALTFDDGPGPFTGRLLDDLGRAGVPATFFVIGAQVRGQEAMLARMVREGHTVGNHTWSHPNLARLGLQATQAQVAATDAAIRAATGVQPTIIRPPYGAMSAAVRQVGQAVILWDVDTLDWKIRSAPSVTQRALAGVRSGSIILMHDIHPSTVAAVPDIIAGLTARGYTLVTVPQLLGQAQPGAVYTRR